MRDYRLVILDRIQVSIRTRPEGRVMLSASDLSARDLMFQSAPGPRAG